MKKIGIFFIILLLSLITIDDKALAINRVFLLDTSGSMRQGGLFDRIKENLKRNYVSKMKQGEHIILLAFDENVTMIVDQSISDETDITEINARIDALKAIGQWTWMTRGLEMTMEQARRLKAQYPDEGLNIYFLSDGINDPPPELNESRLEFVEVLLQYFRDFRIEDTYVYVLVYREEEGSPRVTRENQDEIVKHTDGRVKIQLRPSTSPDPIPPEIRIGYSGFDFGIVNLAEGQVAATGSIGIKEIKGDAGGSVMRLMCETEPFPEQISFEVTPDNFEVHREGQIEKISILIPKNISPGEYLPDLKLSYGDVLLSPNTIPVSFKAVVKDETDRSDSAPYDWTWIWKALLPILIFIIVSYLLLQILWRKTLWVQREGQGSRPQEIKVKNMKKETLESVGLSNYQVGFGFYPPKFFSIFLFGDGEGKRKVIIGEPMKCQDPQGKGISIIFHDKSSTPPSEESIPETEKKQENPDEQIGLKKRDDKSIDFLSDKHKGDIQ